MRRITAAVTGATVALGLAACGAPSEQAGGGEDTLTVGATAVPAGEVLEFVRDELAADAGLDLKIQEFADYNAPNAALAEGELDANLFQHAPFLEDYNANSGTDLVPVTEVYLPPLGLYSFTVDSVEELPDGATVALPNDPTNEYRALLLLQEGGLITLAEGIEESSFSLADIEDNPKDLEFREIDAAQLPRSLEDVDAAIVNANYALDADLSANESAILLERYEGSPYINILAARQDNQDDPRVQKLAEILTSEEVARFIEEEYSGTVIPVASGQS
ncbi:MetQ/NlpA family ABC transporter substrate-binding protein [Marinactinospora thermotolerans]|uniref:Lipoprotein n=1 Tax=Marinactinospora thermotolerans DSM 45154 TaxID=1122192 RepID=A0A1T4RUW3_9ACTN|nr:MetQ/NlpA family ABC transporter substrate-binding protein [Marinactinospora thermotolerans]SKA19769.1 D-methionine transport system substrate-binding protein [Marinactinospora thermotolerans DSM 45154]